MRARVLTRLMLLLAVFSALAHAQVVLTDDANTSSLSPKSNYGSSIALIVCSGSSTYLKFSMANLGSGITSSNVSKATLVLYTDFVLTSGTMDVYQVNGSWSEGSITYNTAPALGTKLFSAVSVTKTGFLSLDLTSSVQAWLNGTLTNNGIALVPSTGSSISVSFDSKENILTSHVAQLPLVLVSAGPQGPAGPIGPTGSIGAQGPAGQQGIQGLMGIIGMTGATGPAGSQGPVGANGTGFNFRNAFDNSASYAVNDVVAYNGSSYVATTANQGPSNPTPDANPAAWSVMAAEGAPGAAGAQGPAGPTGATGAAGPAGAQGPAGATGQAGPSGPVGPTGSAGATGQAGPATVVPNGIQNIVGSLPVFFTVPPGITRLLVEMWGGGGGGVSYAGWAGGYCLAPISVSPGEVLTAVRGISTPSGVGTASSISRADGTLLAQAGGGVAGGGGGNAYPCFGLGVAGGALFGQNLGVPYVTRHPFGYLNGDTGDFGLDGAVVITW